MTVDIHNQLAEDTTLHWHGLEIPGIVDGGPQGIIPGRRNPHGDVYAAATRRDLLDSSAQTRQKPGARWRWALPGWC